MARIRTIKPEAATSTSLARCVRDARLLFLLLLTDADDDGRLHASPKRLAGTLFPHDDDVTAKVVTKWVDQLVDAGQLHRYTRGGADYLHVVNWRKHQRISHRTPSRIPPCSCENEEGDRPPVGEPRDEVENESGNGNEDLRNFSGESPESLRSLSTVTTEKVAPGSGKGSGSGSELQVGWSLTGVAAGPSDPPHASLDSSPLVAARQALAAGNRSRIGVA